MDQVRRFMKFAIVEVVNYAAAMQASIERLALTQKQSFAFLHATTILAMSHSSTHRVLSTEAAP